MTHPIKVLTGEILPPLKNIAPRDYQEWMHNAIASAIRNYTGPFFVEASVGAGKTVNMAIILAQAQLKNIPCLVLARRGELVEQNANTFWEAGVQNSIYSASVNIKSTKYPIIVGSEGTVARSLDGALKDFKPAILVIDECLTGDTLISTEEWGLVRIDSPQLKNSSIWCIDEKTKKQYAHKPVRVFSNGIKTIMLIRRKNGKLIKCTDNHQIYASPGLGLEFRWMPASKIGIGYYLWTEKGFDTVTEIIPEYDMAEVYDIEMPTHHNFFANGILVHNCHEVAFDQEDSQYMKIINELLRRQPKLRIIGLTGSPYRGVRDILGDFWKQCVYRVRTPYLVERGFLVPTIFGFGHDDVQYDLSEFKIDDEDDHSDYTAEELLAMQRKITADQTVTQRIMAEVIELTKHRNCVMITGAGKKHLEQIAECLPPDSWVIITDSTGNKERRLGLKQAYDGKKNFLLQIGCLTTGIDIPLIDTSVIMRKIGSLTLLVQLLGRGMRLLKPFQKEAGIIKEDHLVLDYSGTMDEMADKYNDPVLEKATLDKAKQDEVDLIECPVCKTKNSPRARRCINRVDLGESMIMMPVIRSNKAGEPIRNFSIDGRCEYFFKGGSRECMECGTPNDTSARECRQCEAILIDPNRNLTHKHYVDNDFRKVESWTMALTRDQKGIVVNYLLSGPINENAKTCRMFDKEYEVATEIFFPASKEKWMLNRWYEFLNQHVPKEKRIFFRAKKAIDCIRMMNHMLMPTYITHRINAEKRSIVHRKRFGEREVESHIGDSENINNHDFG